MSLTKRGLSAVVAAVTLTGSIAGTSVPSQARDGAIAFGALGGLAAGALLGSALAGPRYSAPPPPPPTYGYRAYYPAYAPEYDECVRRRVWGPYGWHWITDC